MKHTENPWEVSISDHYSSYNGNFGKIIVREKGSHTTIGVIEIDKMSSNNLAYAEQAEANAEYIVKCVNERKELIEALEKAIELGDADDWTAAHVNPIRAILEKAKP